MPAAPIIDVASLDLARIVVPKEEILALNPQRHEFEQVDALVMLDLERVLAVGIRHQREDEFWVRGHIPGRPLMPGVLMIETAAQVGSALYAKKYGPRAGKFLGFGGVSEVKFRGAVLPGQTLVMAVEALAIKPRMGRFQAQGFVGETMVFEGELTAVSI